MIALAPRRRQRTLVIAPRIVLAYSPFVTAHIEGLYARSMSFTVDGRCSLNLRERTLLKLFFLKHRIDIVLAESGPIGVMVMETCRDFGIPLIVHFLGEDAYASSKLLRYGMFYPSVFHYAASIIAVSRDMERELLSLGAPRGKLHYNPCGADRDLFQGACPASAPPVFVAVGRFVDKKAPYLTVLAFKEVFEKFPEARLRMIGSGILLESCRMLAQALGIDGGVEFFGYRSHREVAVMMKEGRAFVQHSLKTSTGSSEGTPVSVIEAGMAGLPVVATRHAGIKDVVIEGETGLLVDEGDVEGMTRHMLRLAEDPPFAAKLGQRAREWICREFSLEKTIYHLSAIMDGAVTP